MPAISLLWPHSTPPGTPPRLSLRTADDLGLDRLVTALTFHHEYRVRIREILLGLCADPGVIRYRQDILDDLLSHPSLAEHLNDALPKIAALDSFAYFARPGQSPLHEVVWRVGELEAYVEVVQTLQALFDHHDAVVQAEGLRHLRDMVAGIAQTETFQHLARELPEMIANVRSIASVTIGVNLDDQLRPVEATLLAINKRRFQGFSPSLLSTLFGRSADENDWEGLAQLHSARSKSTPSITLSGRGVDVENPMLYPLFRDLAQVLKQTSRPVASALARYTRVNAQVLDGLGAELAFYLGAARLITTLRASGLPVCRPTIADREERACAVSGAYNITLALRLLDTTNDRTPDLRRAVITSDLIFGPEGRIFVLTGPNQGGKTTYTQAAGLVHVLAQAGLFVPGTSARISPVDGIFTHFPVEERPDMESGRLGEEAQRLSEIFAAATRYSLVLLNESLSSTSPGEGLYLARDVVRVLRQLGARAIYATHMHDLAADCDMLNADTPGDSDVISLVSLVADNGANDVKQTFRIVPGPPRGRSYAREIASRYGISYEQLIDLLRERGMVTDEP